MDFDRFPGLELNVKLKGPVTRERDGHLVFSGIQTKRRGRDSPRFLTVY